MLIETLFFDGCLVFFPPIIITIIIKLKRPDIIFGIVEYMPPHKREFPRNDSLDWHGAFPIISFSYSYLLIFLWGFYCIEIQMYV